MLRESELLTKESAVSRGTMFCRHEVIGKFHCKLLLSLENAKAEAIVVEPVKRKTSEFMVI